MPAKTRTYTCCVYGCNEPTHTIGGNCEKHYAEFKAKWKAEHTRQGPTDTRRGWLITDTCSVKIGKVIYDAEILDMSDVSRRESNHDMVKLQLSKTVTGLDGKPYTQSWVHPEPVPSYRLRKRLLSE